MAAKDGGNDPGGCEEATQVPGKGRYWGRVTTVGVRDPNKCWGRVDW